MLGKENSTEKTGHSHFRNKPFFRNDLSHIQAEKNVNLRAVSDQKKSQKTKKKLSGREDSARIFVQGLEDTCRHLEYISETDAAIKPFTRPKPNERSLDGYIKVLNVDERPIEEVGFDEFFDRLTVNREWHRDVDRSRAKRFEKLRYLLQDNLDDIRVIRVGRIRINIYVVGVYDDKQLIGVKTMAIET